MGLAAVRSTRKKDSAPRGVFRHESGAWAIRFACGSGHIHEEKTGSIRKNFQSWLDDAKKNAKVKVYLKH